MHGSKTIERTTKPVRRNDERTETLQERRIAERGRQELRIAERNRKYQQGDEE